MSPFIKTIRREKELKALLRIGDVINLDLKPKWYQFKLRLVYGVIRKYQRKRYSARWRDIHSMLVLDVDPLCVMSFEWPRCVIRPFEIKSRTKYRICRYLPADAKPIAIIPEFVLLLHEAAKKLKDKKYDWRQLLDIWLKGKLDWISDIIPWARVERWKIFDAGRMRKVCSVAVLWCYRYWWHNYWRDTQRKGTPLKQTEVLNLPNDARAFPQPLGKQYVEICCPADFCNNPTFKIVYEE